MLSGRTHSVFTGLAVLGPDAPGKHTEAVETRVTFKPLSDRVISEYFQKVNPLDKAGAYGIQADCSEWIIDRIEGSLSNVIGLPRRETAAALTLFGLKPKPDGRDFREAEVSVPGKRE